jgi:hypothetical protein
MLGKLWTVSFALVGAPGESKNFYCVAPFDCSLYHVSLCNLADGTGTFKITDDGTDITDDAAIGTGSTPTEIDLDDMAGDAYPHIAKDSVIGFTLTDDDTDDVMVVATFLVG